MASSTTAVSSELVICVANDSGTGTISRRYADVKPTVVDADVYDVANGTNGLAKLQSRAVASVQRANTIEIENQ